MRTTPLLPSFPFSLATNSFIQFTRSGLLKRADEEHIHGRDTIASGAQ